MAGLRVEVVVKGGLLVVVGVRVGALGAVAGRVRDLEGSASMDMNYSLAEDDVEEGFILTCQAHPSSDNIYVDYDEM